MDTVEITVSPRIVAGRYEMIRQLGSGGMGTVYLVRHINTDERLAMKVLRKDVSDQLEAVERFKREMKASAILRSDNVTRITDADTAPELDGAMYLVMELLDGADVEKLLTEKRPLDSESVIFILGQAARALDKAHALGIIHRDLKPENLFLHRSEEFGLMVKVLDFGIAMFKTRLESGELRLTQDNTLLGTPLYMAPEQVLGSREEICPRTDVWAIGMIAYDMLVGDNYWKVPSLGMLLSRIALGHMPAPSEVVPSLSKEFDAWFFRSCSRELPARFATVREQVEALATILSVEPNWIDSVTPPPSLLARVNEVSPPDVEHSVSRLSALPRSVRANALAGGVPSSADAKVSATTAASVAPGNTKSLAAATLSSTEAGEGRATDRASPQVEEAKQTEQVAKTGASPGTRKRWMLLLLLLIPMLGAGLFVLLHRTTGNANPEPTATAKPPESPKTEPASPGQTPKPADASSESGQGSETESASHGGKRPSAKGRGKTSSKLDGRASAVGKSAKGKAKIDYDPVAP